MSFGASGLKVQNPEVGKSRFSRSTGSSRVDVICPADLLDLPLWSGLYTSVSKRKGLRISRFLLNPLSVDQAGCLKKTM